MPIAPAPRNAERLLAECARLRRWRAAEGAREAPIALAVTPRHDVTMTRSKTTRRFLLVVSVAGLLGLVVSAAVFARSHSRAVG